MIYHILNYDPDTNIAKGIEASLFKGSNTPSGFVVSLLCPDDVEIGHSYSFQPSDQFIGTVFVRGVLDGNIK